MAKVSYNYWFVLNPLVPLLFSELALKQHCISLPSPAPCIDRSREQLVKRDKVMF